MHLIWVAEDRQLVHTVVAVEPSGRTTEQRKAAFDSPESVGLPDWDILVNLDRLGVSQNWP